MLNQFLIQCNLGFIHVDKLKFLELDFCVLWLNLKLFAASLR